MSTLGIKITWFTYKFQNHYLLVLIFFNKMIPSSNYNFNQDSTQQLDTVEQYPIQDHNVFEDTEEQFLGIPLYQHYQKNTPLMIQISKVSNKKRIKKPRKNNYNFQTVHYCLRTIKQVLHIKKTANGTNHEQNIIINIFDRVKRNKKQLFKIYGGLMTLNGNIKISNKMDFIRKQMVKYYSSKYFFVGICESPLSFNKKLDIIQNFEMIRKCAIEPESMLS